MGEGRLDAEPHRVADAMVLLQAGAGLQRLAGLEPAVRRA